MYHIATVGFSIQDKSSGIGFFEETFLLTDISMKMVLEMPFLALNNADIQFDTRTFI